MSPSSPSYLFGIVDCIGVCMYPPYLQLDWGHLKTVRGRMTTPAKNACPFCLTPAHYTSVLHVLVHEMQLEALSGNRALFLDCNYRGSRGTTWENSEELQRSAWICGDLWGTMERTIRKEVQRTWEKEQKNELTVRMESVCKNALTSVCRQHVRTVWIRHVITFSPVQLYTKNSRFSEIFEKLPNFPPLIKNLFHHPGGQYLVCTHSHDSRLKPQPCHTTQTSPKQLPKRWQFLQNDWGFKRLYLVFKRPSRQKRVRKFSGPFISLT